MASKQALMRAHNLALAAIHKGIEDLNDKVDRLMGESPNPEVEDASAPDPGADATQGAVTLAAELGVDLSEVPGSGTGGKIVKSDVADFAG